ncbi:MAG: DUF1566 domain-containing protein, partial [Leptospiraceae bacterium]|nr:DUF1566 domain-containing protein [Leptospiraceae bacterium]
MNFKKIIYLSIFIFSSLVFSETVNLPNSNLIWQKCTYGLKGDLCKEGKAIMLTWEEASKICKDYKNDNLDWRLPEKEEIQSLISPEKQTPRIDENYFPSTLASNYWSIEDDSGYKNYISFYNGDFGKNVGSSKKAYLRCVANLAPEIDLRKKEFVKEIKENLPFNWYLSLEKSKIYLE